MAEPLATAFVRLRPDTSDFEKDAKRDLTKAGRGLTKEGGKQGKLFGSSFVKGSAGPFRGMLGVVGGPLAGAFAALGSIKVFKGFIDDARESARIGRLTSQVIKTTGGAAKVSAKQVGDLAEAISNKTGADDETIQSGQNLLLQFTKIRNEVGKSNKIFDRASAAAVDMAAAMNKGVVTEKGVTAASKALGRALNDPLKGLGALKKANITFTDSQKKQIETLVESGKTLEAQKIILDEVAKKTGGAAKAAADPLTRLKTIVGNVGEKIGAALLPYVEKAADFLGERLPGAVDKATQWFQSDLLPAIKGVAPVFLAIGRGVGGVIGFFARLPGSIQVVVASMLTLLVLRSRFSGLVTSIRSVGDSISNLGTKATAGGKSGLGGFLGKVGKFTGVFGPAGLAVGVLAGIISSFAGESSEAAGRVDELTEAMKRDSGAIRENTKAVIAKQLADTGLISDARNAGVSFDLVTRAALGQKGAMAQLSAEQKTAQLRLRQLAQPQLHLTEAEKAERRELEKRVTALNAVNKKLGETSSELSKAKQRSKDHAAATSSVNKVTDVMSGKVHKAARAFREHASKLGLNNSEMRRLVSRFGEGRAEFVRQATRMGLNSDKAKTLYTRLSKIPGKYRAEIYADTGPAQRRINKFIKDNDGRTIGIRLTSGGVQFHARQTEKGVFIGPGGRAVASGGYIAGPGGPTDDQIPAWLSNGEFVVRASETRKHRQLLEAINAGGFARGGPVVRSKLTGTAGAQDAVLASGRSLAGAVSKAVSLLMAGGPAVARALSFVRSKVGSPYLWGGVGPNGFDCSGLLSAAINAGLGRNPYSRLGSTASMPWSLFAPGPGRFQVGWFKGNPGHTAATVGGTNIESRGGDGVVMGPRARGANSPIFNARAHVKGFARGGLAKRMGDLPFDLLSPRGKYPLEDLVGGYRRGTPWVPEDQLAWLHKGEGVIPRSINESRLGSTTEVHYHLDVRVDPMASPHETGRKVVESIKAFERGSGKRWRS